MQTAVTFKGLDSSEALKAYVCDKLDRFDRYLTSAAEASVVLKVEKFRHIAEIHVSGDRLGINGTEETDDMYSSIDMVLDKLEKQIKKYKQKHRVGRNPATIKGQGTLVGGDEVMEEAAREVRLVDIEYKPMDVDEASMQLDLSDDLFLVFTNARSQQVNVLYRRNDGHFGLIQPRP